jgi:hypothetical protein
MVTAVAHWLIPFSNPGSYTAKCYRYQIGDANFQVDVLCLHPNQLSEAGAIIVYVRLSSSDSPRINSANFRVQSSKGLVTIDTIRFWLPRRRLLDLATTVSCSILANSLDKWTLVSIKVIRGGGHCIRSCTVMHGPFFAPHVNSTRVQ